MLKIHKRTGDGSFDDPVTIRPTPLISISHTPQKNKLGSVGCVYNITLNGTIIAHLGCPRFDSTTKKVSLDSDDPSKSGVKTGDLLKSVVEKQNKIRELFANDGNKIEIVALSGSTHTNPCIQFFPTATSIDFQEGPYIDTCKYTVNLETPILFDDSGNVFTEALIGLTFSPNNYSTERSATDYLRETVGYNKTTLPNIIQRWGGLVEDFSDTWSIETDESNGQTSNQSGSTQIVPISYLVKRTMSATGKTIYTSETKYEAWQQAAGFIKKTLLQEPNAPPDRAASIAIEPNKKYELYPAYNPYYGSGAFNLPSFYRGYNHVRTMDIDKTAGTCSITETWLLASGQSHLENYTVSTSRSIENSITNVKIEGSIKGLSDMHPSGYHNAQFDFSNSPYEKALNKYNNVSNNGNFGVGSPIYNRAANFVSTSLNPKPLSVSIGSNENTGEITYSIEFDNRPCNVFGDGMIYENITVSDNNPGDVFAVIPVIGRATGPILQYIKGRTEYNRNVSIELLLDYAVLKTGNMPGIPPSSIYSLRTNLVLNKPSLVSSNQFPLRSQVLSLVNELSPANENGVTKYFLRPPTETWNSKEGRYTLNFTWDYEKSN